MRSYDKYKDANVEWIDKIPAHWNAKRVKYLFTFSRGLSITKENLQDEGVPCVNYGEIHSRLGIELNPEKDFLRCVSTDYLESSPNSLLKRGDFVFADTSEDIEGSGNFTFLNSDVPTFAGYHTIITKPSEQFSSKYLAYYFDSLDYRHQIRSVVNGTKVYSITQSILKNTIALLPSSEEQTAIANYLDEKITQIDKLIAKKQKLIELLHAEKLSVITETINSGLDNGIKLKPTKVDYINVPEHWTISKIGYIAKVVRGASPRPAGSPLYFNGNHTPWITVGEVTKDDNKFITDVSEYLTEEGAKQSRFVGEGFLLLSNSGATLGVPKILKIGGCINDGSVAFLNLDKKISIDFLYYFFKSLTETYRDQMKGYGQPNLNTDIVKGTQFCYPSLEEQISIVKHIEIQLDKIFVLIEKIDKEIELIEEYKASIISEVVTGKYKVIN